MRLHGHHHPELELLLDYYNDHLNLHIVDKGPKDHPGMAISLTKTQAIELLGFIESKLSTPLTMDQELDRLKERVTKLEEQLKNTVTVITGNPA